MRISKIKIGIVSSSFRPEVTDNLERHCLHAFRRKRINRSQVDIIRVPGSLEIPLAAKKMAKTGKYQALIAFGAVVKGKTYHFEQISNECARGCMEVSLKYEIPVIFEVWSVYDLQDAVERATRAKENKGAEAAETVLKMIEVISKI